MCCYKVQTHKARIYNVIILGVGGLLWLGRVCGSCDYLCYLKYDRCEMTIICSLWGNKICTLCVNWVLLFLKQSVLKTFLITVTQPMHTPACGRSTGLCQHPGYSENGTLLGWPLLDYNTQDGGSHRRGATTAPRNKIKTLIIDSLKETGSRYSVRVIECLLLRNDISWTSFSTHWGLRKLWSTLFLPCWDYHSTRFCASGDCFYCLGYLPLPFYLVYVPGSRFHFSLFQACMFNV